MTAPRVLALTLCAGLVAAAPALAQDTAELRRRRDAKLAKPFLRHNDWETGYEAALARAQQSGQPDAVVFAYFTRSYGT